MDATSEASPRRRAGIRSTIFSIGVGGGSIGPDPDQDHPLQTQLAVLDLADVDQFGGEPGDPP